MGMYLSNWQCLHCSFMAWIPIDVESGTNTPLNIIMYKARRAITCYRQIWCIIVDIMFTVHFKSIKYALKPSCSLSSINNKMYLTHTVYTKKGTTFPQYLTNVSTTIAKLQNWKQQSIICDVIVIVVKIETN